MRTNSRAAIFSVVWTIAASAALLWLASFIMQPIPVPAATAVAGGVALFWCTRSRRGFWTIIGAVCGVVVGAALHVRVHIIEDRTDEGTFGHFAIDAGIGAAIATGILLVAIMPPVIAQRTSRR